ncbi:hypothetical protein QZM93_26835 [Burkholderia cepacia]|uniref:hypothetical protein n=1 Tax=Burkholderia cepacia TaxID=292 RepID=UPI0011B6C8FF|nr:hypothetical protein [Burkholderia cepacia]MDN7892234.1 hypothetical protein [Burkholderia cepacia]UQO38035.1 hypothetical protein L0Z22_20455 [Burkholderia cepacia]UQO52373.1 hypothetical protein L0Z05_26585 [Burkholderia cepacia]UQP06518.1 hypothetical protein L0Z01_03405 [Burkholderia cepacia]
MKTYNSLLELIENVQPLPGKNWIYANLDSWRDNPKGTRFFYIPWDYIQDLDDDEIYLDAEDMEMPKSVENYDLRCWMLVNQLNYIRKNRDDRGEGIEWFVDEVNYYRENDEFRT